MEQFVRMWIEKGLSIYDLNRLVRAKRTCSIPDELGRLAGKNVQLTSEEAYSLIDGVYQWASQLGVWPLDSTKDPEEFSGETDDLPTCVLATSESTYIDYNDMPRILALYDGTNIPDWVPEYERQNRLRRQRRRPVLTAICREDGCNETIIITVGMAGHAIRNHRLIESGDLYEPSTLCKKHRAARDKLLKTKRLAVPISEAAKAKSDRRRAAAAARATQGKEDDANQDVASPAPLTEPEEPQEAPPQEPQAEPERPEAVN